ncbi:hypothetical protein Tco_0046959 [Tanacetum coccineum]
MGHRFNDLLRACPHHGFSELHQLDTFYNALNSNDQDSLNSAAGGNFLDKMPRDCLRIIESKSKVRNSRNKPVVAKVSTSTSTPGISSEVAELKDMVKALLLDKKNQSPAPTPVKAVEESCVTCGGAHSYQTCPATTGNVYRDNIQEYVSQAAAANYNQGNTVNKGPGFKIIFDSSRFSFPLQLTNPQFSEGHVYRPQVVQPPVLSSSRPIKAQPTRFKVEREPEVTKDTMLPTNNGSTEVVQPLVRSFCIEDDPTSPEVDPTYYDPDGDILLLEAILNRTDAVWILLLQTFDVVFTRINKEQRILAPYHLSRLEEPTRYTREQGNHRNISSRDSWFSCSCVYRTPWFADFAKLPMRGIALSRELSSQLKNNFQRCQKTLIREDPSYSQNTRAVQMFRRCRAGKEASRHSRMLASMDPRGHITVANLPPKRSLMRDSVWLQYTKMPTSGLKIGLVPTTRKFFTIRDEMHSKFIQVCEYLGRLGHWTSWVTRSIFYRQQMLYLWSVEYLLKMGVKQGASPPNVRPE